MRRKLKINGNWKEKRVEEYICSKEGSQLCGTACMNYICGNEGITNKDLCYNELFWIMDLANFILERSHFKAILFYFESRLMKDYKNKLIDEREHVMHAINTFVHLGGVFVEKRFFMEELIHCKEESKWLILNVRSDVLFEDYSLKGHNHFVILESCNMEEAVVISPGLEELHRMFIKSELLFNALQDNGQWILSIICNEQIGL